SGRGWAARRALVASRSRCPELCATDALYAEFRAGGLEYGPSFQGLATLRRGRDEALGEIALPAAGSGVSGGYRVHPVLLDSAFQLALPARPFRDRGTYL